MMNLRGLEGLNGVVKAVKEEKTTVAVQEAMRINAFGQVLTQEAIKELVWTVDTHIGNILGHYLADEASLVGMMTWAGEMYMAMKTAEDVLRIIAEEKDGVRYLAKDGKGTQKYTSQFTTADIAELTGCRGLKLKAVVVKGEEVAEKILTALLNWNVVGATDEEVLEFVGDITRMIRACQEIEIDITKDKSLKRFMDLTQMIREGAYILSHKFKTQPTKTNPGLVTNEKELRQQRLSMDNADLNYTVECGWLKYEVGASEEDITKTVVTKTVDEALVSGAVVDEASEFMEKLMDKGMEAIKVGVAMTRMAETDYVITETIEDIQGDVIPQAVCDLSREFSRTMTDVKNRDRAISFNKNADKKALRNDLSRVARNTAKVLWMCDDYVYDAAAIDKLTKASITPRQMFSKMVVCSELYNPDRKVNDFELKHAIPTTKSLFKAEYLTLAVENDIREFIVDTHNTFGVAKDVADGEVKIVARNIMKDGEIVGRVISDRLAKEVTGKKFYLERDEEGNSVLVEKMNINAMGAFSDEKELLVTVDPLFFDEYTEEDLLIDKKKDNKEILEKKYELRNEYVNVLTEYLVDNDNVVYNHEQASLILDPESEYATSFKISKSKSAVWKNAMLGLISNPSLTPEENKKVKAAKAKEIISVPYVVKDVFFSGNKLSMVVVAK